MNDYYKEYLNNHSNPKCRLMHFIGQWVTIFFIAFVFYSKIWLLAPLIPFVIYPFAISGHILFQSKENSPSFTKMGFIRAKIADWKMFIEILKGNISIW
tara:strand:- start:1465 stop:1761 length:297 start_codon:yes stop_codon:yes gene_type:complete